MPHCCFGNCNSDSRVGRPGFESSIKFYPFPKACFTLRDSGENWSKTFEKRHLKVCKMCQLCWDWMIKCKRDDYKFQSVLHATNAFICSKHFAEAPITLDYENTRPLPSITPSASRKRRQSFYMKRMASHEVPFSLQPSNQNENDTGISERYDSPSELGEEADEVESIVPTTSIIEEPVSDIVLNNDAYVEAMLTDEDDMVSSVDQGTQVFVETKDACTQTTWVCRDMVISTKNIDLLSQQIKTLKQEIDRLQKKHDAVSLEIFEKKLGRDDEMCKYYTGMDNKQLAALHYFCKGDQIIYWGNETTNISEENERLSNKPNREKERKLSRSEELLLFFLRLRGGLLIEDIAYRFGLARTTISRIVTTYIQYLYDKFSWLRSSMFPSRDIIKKTLPGRFKKFNNIRVIIDCAEIFCEKPSNFEQQGNTYSEYKARATFKVLLGCTPNGAVSFVSDLFEGSISDKQIVEESGLIDLLEEGDMILADRGFTIQSLTDEKGVVLRIPAFLKGRDSLTHQEELQTKEIAANRIFIEHVVGRLKKFRFFQRTVPLSMRHVLSQAVFVCACLLNFQEPLVK